MDKIPFKATIRKIGNSYMVTIPKEWIGEEVKENGTYNFTIHLDKKQEVENNAQARDIRETEATA